MKFLVTFATLLPLPLLISATGSLRSPTCKGPSTKVMYDFEEFQSGDKIRSLGGGDVKIYAKRYKYSVTKNKLVLRKAKPMAFDTGNPTGGDFDLATRDLGIVLIVSEDGNASDPDDNELGGSFTFVFERDNAIINELLVLDTEEGGRIRVIKKNGKSKSFDIPKVGDGGRASIKIGVRGVAKMVVCTTDFIHLNYGFDDL